MGILIEIVLFLLPIGAYVLWLRQHPGEAPPRAVLFAAIGLLFTLLVAAWYWLDHSTERGAAYVPATLDASGTIRPGRMERR